VILHRLYELAERQRLLADPAFEMRPVPFILQLAEDGRYLAPLAERRGVIETPARKKGAPAKVKKDKGDLLSVPKAHGSPANKGFARFFVDTLGRVLPLDDDAKSARSRDTFWQQIDQAADATADPALRAVQTFGRCLRADAALQAALRAELEALKPAAGDRCTFAWFPDGGKTIVEREPVRAWYRRHYTGLTGTQQQAKPQGLCQITREIGPLARAHATKVAGVPGGIASGVSLVSNDKAAFESYGLDGAVNAGIGFRAAEGYARALNELISNRLFPGKTTSFRIAGTLFVYWTRRAEDLEDLMVLDHPEPDDVARLLASPGCGHDNAVADPEQFYCLCLSGNSARAIVRSYLEIPLSEVRQKLARWFEDLQTVDDSARGQGQVTGCFRLVALAGATVRDLDDLSPGVPPLLLAAALQGTPLPSSLLAACLQRLRLEAGPEQFRPARMGLIRLLLNRDPQRGELTMPQSLDPALAACSPAYACGRLLAFLARCQKPESFGAEAQILERFYGTASTAPRSVFPVLLRLNRHHIEKIREEHKGFATNLEKELEERLAPFRPGEGRSANFPDLLSLAEQGQFALGFYHQRADYRRQSAVRKAAAEQPQTIPPVDELSSTT
jgi:CRISPR-associated protein Csd1